ncbi:hypothetical protein Y032_0063g3404 [Ancylostoma ceylanicum]|uniref:Uncharacterized protein n=1 Tax=Ancylostoma ceylanicum TaxID=53326 RepID=A0A016U2N0_9BILA|nr:hypothetical protein Y032_0063g3404 [Ancylostoma ceylanicum]
MSCFTATLSLRPFTTKSSRATASIYANALFNESFVISCMFYARGIFQSDTVAVKKMKENDDNRVLQVLMSYHTIYVG